MNMDADDVTWTPITPNEPDLVLLDGVAIWWEGKDEGKSLEEFLKERNALEKEPR